MRKYVPFSSVRRVVGSVLNVKKSPNPFVPGQFQDVDIAVAAAAVVVVVVVVVAGVDDAAAAAGVVEGFRDAVDEGFRRVAAEGQTWSRRPTNRQTDRKGGRDIWKATRSKNE